MNLKKYYSSVKHLIPLLVYAIFYLASFVYLEKTITMDSNITIIHLAIDDYIPFIEWFVIPYYLWFIYVVAVVALTFFTNKHDYYRCCAFLFIGMTLFIIISAIWPNGHALRPDVMPRDNIFTNLIAQLYLTDTSTNIVPSIHVYNSLGAHIALMACSSIKLPNWLKVSSLILCISIVLSTVFIKQHSVFDMITAFILAGVTYYLIYKKDILKGFLKNIH